jgi:signal recognition particle GTPase
MLQRDVEKRSQDLFAALEREQKRREEERKEEQEQQQQQQQQEGQNRFNQQRQKLVSLIAELEMLKQLESDTRRSTEDLETLVSLRQGDDASVAEAALVERLLHRHAEITKLFEAIKQGVEETMQSMQQGDEEAPKEGSGR